MPGATPGSGRSIPEWGCPSRYPLLVRLPLLLTGLVLVAGCGGEQAPAALPVPAASAAPTTITLPAPRASGEAGKAERGVLAYYQGLNTMLLQSDTAPYRAVFEPGCRACTEFADSLEPLFAKGQRLDGAQDEVRSVRVVLGPGGSAVADVSYTVTPHRLVDAEGAEVDSFPAEDGAAALTLARQPGGDYRVVSSQDTTVR